MSNREPMIKDHLWPEPCRSKAPSFREFIEEELALDDLLGDPQIMEILIKIGRAHV